MEFDISWNFEKYLKISLPTFRHTGINLHFCKICYKIFTTRTKLKRHMSTHAHDGRTFQCHLCSFRFDQSHALRIHFNMKHLVSKKDEIHCTFCQKIFLSQNAFDRHLKIVGYLTKN